MSIRPQQVFRFHPAAFSLYQARFRMYLRILIVCFCLLALPHPAPAQASRRKARAPRPAATTTPAPASDAPAASVALRQNEPKGWVWVSQTINLAKQLGGDENIYTIDGEPPPEMITRRVTLGLVIDAEGHIVTRLFDVSPTNPPMNVAAYALGTKRFPARFLGMDSVTGLCVLKSEGANFQPATISTSSTLPLRQAVRLYGFHPNLNQNAAPGLSLDRPRRLPFPGLIEKATRDFRFNTNNPIYYLLSPKLTPVQDCSLILEKNESVFGVAIYDIGSEGRHLVYPISRVQTIAQAVIKTHKSLAYGWLGITGLDVPSVIKTQMANPAQPEPGVIITAVAPDSPADLAGVRPKDILLGINDRRIESRAQLSTALRNLPPDCEITLKIKRESEYKTLKTTLVPAPATEPDQQLIAFTRRLEVMEEELKALPPTDPSREKIGPRVDMMRTFVGLVTSQAPPDIRLRVYYGLEIQPLTGQLMNYFAVTNGVLITSTVENNKAARAGLQAGDVIVKAGEQQITSLSNLLAALDGASTPQVEITVSRRKELVKVNYTR